MNIMKITVQTKEVSKVLMMNGLNEKRNGNIKKNVSLIQTNVKNSSCMESTFEDWFKRKAKCEHKEKHKPYSD